MIPQKQTIHGEEGRIRGNCLAACLASLCDVDLRFVPNFADSEDWGKDMLNWLDSTPMFFEGTTQVHGPDDLPGSYGGVDGYVIVCGQTDRGTLHAVIYKDGEPYFDPHPDNTFLISVAYWFMIRRAKPEELTLHQRVLYFLRELRESFPDAEKVYGKGSCHRLYLILRSVFPKAECFHDSDHALTRIGGAFYDISGQVIPAKHERMGASEYPYLIGRYGDNHRVPQYVK